MKKAFVVVLVLLFFFVGFLTGMWFHSLQDRQTPQMQETQPAETAEAPEGQIAEALPNAQQLGVGETASLGPNNLPATLFVAPGYCLYVPEEGWNLKQTAWAEYQNTENFYAGVPCTRWTTATNSSELRIDYFPDSGLEEVRARIAESEPDYDLYEDKQGGIRGSSRNDGTFLEVQLIPSGGGVVMIAMRYPMEDLESSGYALHYMADSLVIYDGSML